LNEFILFLGGIAVGVLMALLLARSRRGDALLDTILDWVSSLIGHSSPVRDDITEKFLELLTEEKSKTSETKTK